jgi:NADP-dependent 3-hydroxy acid dehydrogenase YdfG
MTSPDIKQKEHNVRSSKPPPMACRIALEPEATAAAIAYAIEQPSDVGVNEIVVRPTRPQR